MAKKYVVLDDSSTQASTQESTPTEAEPTRAARAAAEARLVLITGKGAGGPDHLAGGLVDVLIECERRGTATVMLASVAGDLDTPVAAVCRYIATDQPGIAEDARRRFGAERVHTVPSVSTGQIRDWAGDLLTEAGRATPIRARLGQRADRIMPIRALYGKIRGRNTRSRGAGRGASQTPD